MSQKHKVKKGEKFQAIAKKYKFKNPKLIWEDAENKALKKKRGKPENIEPGDVIFIPMTPEEKKDIQARRQLLLSQIENERLLAEALTVHADSYAAAAARFGRYIKESNTFYSKMQKQLETDHKTIQKMKQGVDVVWMLTGMARTSAKLGADYKKALADPSEFTKLNEKVTKAAASIANKPMQMLTDDAKKAVREYIIKKGPKELKTAFDLHKIYSDSLDNMQSPSFWFLAAASKMDGKDFSASMTRDLAAEKKEQVGSLTIQRRVEVAKMEAVKAKCEAYSKEHRTAAKGALFRVKLGEKLLKLLETH